MGGPGGMTSSSTSCVGAESQRRDGDDGRADQRNHEVEHMAGDLDDRGGRRWQQHGRILFVINDNEVVLRRQCGLNRGDEVVVRRRRCRASASEATGAVATRAAEP
jgi:hypothetical protein